MHPGGRTVLLTLFLLAGMCPVFGAGFKQLHGHVPEATKRMAAIARLSPTNELHLAIGVPLRDPAGLDRFLADVYDPASPNYRHFLTPAEFTARFSATEADYAAVKNFALTNGFKVTHEHINRLLLDVSAKMPDVERAFQIKLNRYKHPTEAREFFAPDAEPLVAAALPVSHVSGLENFFTRQPRSVRNSLSATANASPKNGSGPVIKNTATYMGSDFRKAYVPGVSLTGAGQSVALLQFDGYVSNDIVAYANTAGLTMVSLTNVMLDGGYPVPGGGNDEVCLDIEMVMSMAPGISQIIVYEGGGSQLWPTILSAIANDNLAKQVSCSWGNNSPGGIDDASETIFKQMAAQGQSFFNASGDSDAFVGGIPFPSESTNITQVGGTTLTMNGTGASYASETVWNWGGGTGSSGGISANFGIPPWQQGISMVANHGSTTMNNVPDVALTADNVLVISDTNQQSSIGGTSCAAPLWAGFMALVNQQVATVTGSATNSAGFINPAVYAIGKGLNPNYSYTACFHDITSGNNYWSSSPTNFPAVTGYDLCTGWGTPTGTNLIFALAGVADALSITPVAGFAASGVVGGPFTGGSQTFTLTNTSASSLAWSLMNTSAWLTVSNSGGTLTAHQKTNVTINLAAAANNLGFGSYTAMISFSNQTSHVTQLRQFSLQTLSALGVSPASGFTASGTAGGPFDVNVQNFTLTNLSAGSFSWGIINTSVWLSASPSTGLLAGGATASVAVSLNASASTLPIGFYKANVLVTNQGVITANLPFTLQVVNALQVNPSTGFTASGAVGGPFDVNAQNFTLTNLSAGSFSWGIINTSVWLSASPSTGLLAGGATASMAVSLNASASKLPAGVYNVNVLVTNQGVIAANLPFTLQVVNALQVNPSTGFTASGAVGGPFDVNAQNFTLTNLSAGSFSWGIVNTSAWLSASPSTGLLAGGTTTSMAFSLNDLASKLPAGIYNANVLVTNQGITSANLSFTLQVGQSIVQNGGFEAGTFADWTLVGNTVSGNVTYNTVASANNANGWLVAHSGSYGAFLGDTQVATLSQILTTVPGQSYQVSLWLDNPTSGITQIFLVNWNTNSTTTNKIYGMTNPPAFTWSNITLVVTATGTYTTLQIGAENDPNYFGFDDVSVTPIPAPTVTGYGKVTNGFALTWNTLPGFTNLIQYKTNLLQANWINLATNIATTNVITFTATNGLDPRRFYRVQRL